MKLTIILALIAATLALTTPAWADGAPVPAPWPSFREPVAAKATEQLPSSPTTRAVVTTKVTPDTATAAIAKISTVPQPVTLTAQITDEGEPIHEGVVWRVYTTKTDSAGQLTLADRSDRAVANLQLPPGDYVVHVAYGRAQATDTMTVHEGVNEKSIVLEAGGLRLNSAVVGDVPIPINLLHFDIFTGGGTDADRTLVVSGVGANDLVTLNAGTYHVVSYFGEVNATVRADLRVEPGQMTDATLYQRAAQISFKLVTEAGGEAIADIDWTVKTADGATIFSNTGTFPSTVLAEGDYLVLAKRGDKIYNREFESQAGQPREIEVLTSVY